MPTQCQHRASGWPRRATNLTRPRLQLLRPQPSRPPGATHETSLQRLLRRERDRHRWHRGPRPRLLLLLLLLLPAQMNHALLLLLRWLNHTLLLQSSLHCRTTDVADTLSFG